MNNLNLNANVGVPIVAVAVSIALNTTVEQNAKPFLSPLLTFFPSQEGCFLAIKKFAAKEAEEKAINTAFSKFEQETETGVNANDVSGLSVKAQTTWLGFNHLIPTLAQRAFV